MSLTTKKKSHLADLSRNADKLDAAKFNDMMALQRKANEGKDFVRVRRLEMRPGEEVWDFVGAMVTAIQTNRVVLANGSLDARLVGIYDDHVIVQDGNTGRMYKSTFSRTSDGEFAFSEPVEVRMEYVECACSDGVEKRAADVVVEVPRGGDRKWGFLPPTLRR